MRHDPSRAVIAAKGGAATLGLLAGGLVIGSLIGFALFEALPGHSIVAPDGVHIIAAAVPAFAGFLVGGAAWGIWMGRAGRSPDRGRMALAGMVGFAPVTLALGIGLSAVEPIVVEAAGGLPVHRVFTLLFVPSVFLAAATSAGCIGLGLRKRARAWRMALEVGAAAALTFLAINLAMEAMGWVVGGPGALARATMLTVMLVGLLGSALSGGAVLGLRVDASRCRA